ncbi:transglutaminase domain-containing protein [Haloarcula sp. S1CR25-12]|uniref:Transglutaminase domain-containing protein n=1 Tax=Haloarcula saliterrae TaxID=2950534 RepID=A0ABU2FF15_9EURY|nr:transglutaminase domain-containing protein [Haloarcula sp. S1CR25-12]MDS0260827.1 transglutaminase domain-containing protein [Haloarcula sp. S1CR25-12]
MSRFAGRLPWPETRVLALLAVALVLGAPLRTMYHLVDVVGSPTQFLLVAAVALVAAALLARVLHPILAIVIGAGLFGFGLLWYVTNLTTNPSLDVLLADTVQLLTGRRLLQIANVRLWVTSFVAAPVFLTTYFALRRWYVTAVLVSSVTLSFFVLTTDAGVVTTLLGVVGGVAGLGFGTLDTIESEGEPVTSDPADDSPESTGGDDDIDAGRRSVLAQLAAVVVLPTLVSRIPGIDGTVLSVLGGAGGTIEASLVDAGESLSIQGSVSLSSTHRFTVDAAEPRYWRVGTYDRYTGDGWVRTGGVEAYDDGDGLSDGPADRTRELVQTFEAESAIGTVPAAWKPVRYEGDAAVGVTRHDGFQPEDGLESGDSYRVESALIEASEEELRTAGDDYPSAVEGTYLQLPESTPDRVAETTATLTENAETPYQTALVVERWLEQNRGYSLDVSRPRRNVADRFLHAMSEGYCVYFATTMAVMLRTQGIPARMTVGYTPGEEVEPNRWEVRGLHSHAWVEVYIEDWGWVQFDPTPAGPRQTAERQQLDDDAESDDSDGRETPTETETAETPTPTPTGTTQPGQTPTETRTRTATRDPRERRTTERTVARNTTERGGRQLPALPTREEAALGVVALLGTVAGLRQAGVPERVSRALWLRYQTPQSPEEDIEQAFQRAMYVVGERHRQREAGETVRAYLDAVGAEEDVRRLAALREQLRYGGSVSSEAAEEAIDIADRIVAER